MKKLSALLLTLIFALSLAACKKDNTSSDTSSLSNATSQAEQSETDISEEQSSEITAESETESKTETVASSTTPAKKGTAPKSNPEQNANSQPKSGAPSQNPSNNNPTQPTQPTQPSTPTKLNPKTNFKIGRYNGKCFDNNNQVYYKISMEFVEDKQNALNIVTCYIDGFATKEICEQNGWFFSDETHIENGITYYYCYSLENIINGIFEMTDTLIKVGDQGGKWDNFSLNTDGTLVLEADGGVTNAKVGTIFTLAQ